MLNELSFSATLAGVIQLRGMTAESKKLLSAVFWEHNTSFVVGLVAMVSLEFGTQF
jgi:hypothetical protein